MFVCAGQAWSWRLICFLPTPARGSERPPAGFDMTWTAACRVSMAQEKTSRQQRELTQDLRRHWGFPHITTSKPNPVLRVPPLPSVSLETFVGGYGAYWPLSITLPFFCSSLRFPSLVTRHMDPQIFPVTQNNCSVPSFNVGRCGELISINSPKAIPNSHLKDILGIYCASVSTHSLRISPPPTCHPQALLCQAPALKFAHPNSSRGSVGPRVFQLG